MHKNDKGIAYFIKKQNLRQIDLAEDLGIKRYYLSFIETKKMLPGMELAERISERLKASMGQLWTEEELNTILERR